MKFKNIAVIGAGNGGQAIAGYLSSLGYRVKIYDRNQDTVRTLNDKKKIILKGALNVEGTFDFASTDLAEVIKEAELIMIVTTATAHRHLAIEMSSILREDQIIVLNPGRTCGALEFSNTLKEYGLKSKVYIAETQTLIYACRLISPGLVNIIGVKDKVLIAAFPSSDTSFVLNVLKPIFPSFRAADNVLQTSFENVGAMFHPTVVLLNEAAIERGESFYFYRDMTKGLSNIIEGIDEERRKVAAAYGIQPISAFEWVSYAYDGVEGKDLCERMQNNPAYYEIIAPTSIDCRQITEDIPTGIVPMAELGRAAGVDTPIMDSLISLCSVLHQRNYKESGRTLKHLGLEGLTCKEIIKKLN